MPAPSSPILPAPSSPRHPPRAILPAPSSPRHPPRTAKVPTGSYRTATRTKEPAPQNAFGHLQTPWVVIPEAPSVASQRYMSLWTFGHEGCGFGVPDEPALDLVELRVNQRLGEGRLGGQEWPVIGRSDLAERAERECAPGPFRSRVSVAPQMPSSASRPRLCQRSCMILRVSRRGCSHCARRSTLSTFAYRIPSRDQLFLAVA